MILGVWLLRHSEGLALLIVLAVLLALALVTVCGAFIHWAVLDVWNHEGMRQAFHAKSLTSGGAWWVVIILSIVI